MHISMHSRLFMWLLSFGAFLLLSPVPIVFGVVTTTTAASHQLDSNQALIIRIFVCLYEYV